MTESTPTQARARFLKFTPYLGWGAALGFAVDGVMHHQASWPEMFGQAIGGALIYGVVLYYLVIIPCGLALGLVRRWRNRKHDTV